eukprot:5928908-Pleurochrysis_carterae.AAC.1
MGEGGWVEHIGRCRARWRRHRARKRSTVRDYVLGAVVGYVCSLSHSYSARPLSSAGSPINVDI